MKTILAFCFGALVCLDAAANTFGNDRSEAWVVSGESGSGVLMIQQQGIIFMALFIYGQNSQPTWYSATLIFDSSTQTYSGDLIATTGPAFTAPVFDQNTVTRAVVGTATLVATDFDHGALTYTVNGQAITKSLERLTWAQNALGGHYYGGLIGALQGCSLAQNNNGSYSSLADLTIVHNGSQLTVSGNFVNNSGAQAWCAYAATYGQAGRMGHATGTYTCSDGDHGSFGLSALEATANGFLANASAVSVPSGCMFSGRFGAIRKD